MSIADIYYEVKPKLVPFLEEAIDLDLEGIDQVIDDDGEYFIKRPTLTKLIWGYVKKHDLQDNNNRRKIIPDRLLEPILGGKTDMLQLQKKLNTFLGDQVEFLD